jgi:hypothetical protein
LDEGDGKTGPDTDSDAVWDHEYAAWRLQAPAFLQERFARIDSDIAQIMSERTQRTQRMVENTQVMLDGTQAMSMAANTETPAPAAGTGSAKRTVSGWIADHLPAVEPTRALRVEVKRLFQELKQDGIDADGAMKLMKSAAEHVKIALLMHAEDGLDLVQTAQEALACAWATPQERAAAHMILAIVGTDAQVGAVAGAA